MKKTLFTLTLLSLVLLPLLSVSAALLPQLAINPELKQCQSHSPSGKYTLPSGWQWYDFPDYTDIEKHKTVCEQFGYTYVEGPLKMKISLTYIAVTIIWNIIFLVPFLIILIKFIKTKKIKYLIFALIILLIYYVLYSFNKNSIG